MQNEMVDLPLLYAKYTRFSFAAPTKRSREDKFFSVYWESISTKLTLEDHCHRSWPPIREVKDQLLFF